MKADDEWSTYSENGWNMQYRHITQNMVYVTAIKTVQSSAPTKPGDLEIAGLPFTPSFAQYITCTMDVSGSIVGNGRARVDTNHGMYLYTPSYGSAVSYTVFGIVAVS